MLTRLTAEESLLAVSRAGIGAGTMEEGQRHMLQAAWARAADDAQQAVGHIGGPLPFAPTPVPVKRKD